MSTQQPGLFTFGAGAPSCRVEAFEAECQDLFVVIGTHDAATAVAALIDCLGTDTAHSVAPERFRYGYYIPLCPPHSNSDAEWIPAESSDPHAVPGIAWHL